MFRAFLKELFANLRPYLKAVLILFVLSIIIGATTFGLYPEFLIKILDVFKDKFGADPALNFALVLDIFKQNLIASLIGLFGGLLLGLGSILIVSANGFIIGYILAAVLSLGQAGGQASLPGQFGWQGIIQDIKFLILGLAPHGIVEIPTILLVSALGLRLGLFWLKKQNKGMRFRVFLKDLKFSVLVIPAIVLLLFLAALLEVFVSGRLIR